MEYKFDNSEIRPGDRLFLKEEYRQDFKDLRNKINLEQLNISWDNQNVEKDNLLESRRRTPVEEELNKNLAVLLIEQPERLESTAKFLVSVIGVLMVIISTTDIILIKNTISPLILVIGLFFWSTSSILCLFVLFPSRHSISPESPSDIQNALKKIVSRKMNKLINAFILFFVGLSALAYIVVDRIIQFYSAQPEAFLGFVVN